MAVIIGFSPCAISLLLLTQDIRPQCIVPSDTTNMMNWWAILSLLITVMNRVNDYASITADSVQKNVNTCTEHHVDMCSQLVLFDIVCHWHVVK